MKQCATCGEFKDESEYNWRNKMRGVRWGTCKSCQSEQRSKWYKKNKDRHVLKVRERKKRIVQEAQQYVWDYLSSHPCIDCGETNPIVLEFDHVRGRKKDIISNLVRQGYKLETIMREIAKCEVRCSNCHRIRTSKDQGWFTG